MRFNKKRLAGVAALAALLIAGSAAYTNTLGTVGDSSNNVAGYGTVSVSGTTAVTSIVYATTQTDPPYVTSVTFVASDGPNPLITADDYGWLGFNGTGENSLSTLSAAVPPVVGAAGSFAVTSNALISCGTGTEAAGADTFVCTLPAGSAMLVSAITATDLAVEDGQFQPAT
jgi:hypothetical protein